MREIVLIIAVVISCILILVAIPKINTLYKSNKITSSTRALLLYMTIITPIIGFIIVEITNFKIHRDLSH